MWGYVLTRTGESVIFAFFGFVWGMIVTVPAVHWWNERFARKRRERSLKHPS